MQYRSTRTPWVLSLAIIAACNGSSSGATLVDIDLLTDGEQCADGGIVIQTGLDTSGDGVLDDDEITGTETVCNGSSAVSTLLITTALEVGDDTCPNGGIKFEAGADDGEPGGVAGDGILQPEEVDSTEFSCTPPGAGAGSSDAFVPFDPPTGAAGTATINTKGGQGTNGSGGDGGYFEAYVDEGSIGGGVRLYTTGSADASWTYPATVSFDLGAVPWTVTANTTVPSVAGPDGLTDGDPYTLRSDSNLYVYDSAGEDPVVTGISVVAGVTLTFEENFPILRDGDVRFGAPSNPPVGRVEISLDSDFHLAGTLTTTGDGPNRPDLSLDLDVFVGEASGLIDSTGADSPSGNGGDGGDLDIDAYDDDVDNTEEDPGAIFNQAAITTSGGDGLRGGDAGDIDLACNLHLYNTAALTAVGGNGTAEDGGNGGDVDLNNDYASNLNSGDIDASGGSGVNGGGGDGGDVYTYNGYWGSIRNTGDITTNGGDATACIFGCSAGDGGDIEWSFYANDLRTSGTLSATGGNASAASGATVTGGPFGGRGGDLDADCSSEDGWFDADSIPMGDMVFSGSIDLSGGDGGDGGDGGHIEIDLDAEDVPNNQQVLFLGYQSGDLSGGDGAQSGGDAGYVQLYTEYAEWNDGYHYGAGGPVINYADFTLVGGDGANGDGGDGGWFEMFTSEDYAHDAPWEQALNFGDVDARGGNGSDVGGDGGAFYLWGYNGAENHGDVTCDGGNGVVEGGFGADQYDEWDQGIHIGGDGGPVVNTGNLSSKGGTASGSSGTGGEGQVIQIVGTVVTNSGNLDSSGGAATGTTSIGGDAGDIFILSMYGDTTNTATTLTTTAGSGTLEDGDGGLLFLDGQNQTGNF